MGKNKAPKKWGRKAGKTLRLKLKKTKEAQKSFRKELEKPTSKQRAKKLASTSIKLGRSLVSIGKTLAKEAKSRKTTKPKSRKRSRRRRK